MIARQRSGTIKYGITHILSEKRKSERYHRQTNRISGKPEKILHLVAEGEAVVIPHKENKNVVIISEREYKLIEKNLRNARYTAMLEEIHKQYEEGRIVVKTFEELDEMAK